MGSERLDLGWHRPMDLAGWRLAPGVSPAHLTRRANARRPLRWPVKVPARGLRLPPHEPVLAAHRGGRPIVYPFSLLHQCLIVNDRARDEPLLVAFCGRCRSGTALDPTVGGRVFTFRPFGGYQGSMVMQDDQTGSIWSPVTGQALAGPQAGALLWPLPVETTTLGRWLERHPDSLTPNAALEAPPPPPAHPGVQGWQRWTISHADDRLDGSTRVLGVEVADRARAYVIDPDRPGPRLLQDEVDGTPIALLASAGAWPGAFERRTDPGVLDLRLDGERVRDASGSSWEGDGRAVDGPLAGLALRPLRSVMTNWYAWAGYHPGSEISSAAVPATARLRGPS